jgi:hypothetical protein
VEKTDLSELARAGARLADQRAALMQALRERGVSDASTEAVFAHVRDGIVLTGCKRACRSRIGGPGRLPVGVPWPRRRGDWHLGFLAELALGELPAVPPLPNDGTLLVFEDMETWGSEYGIFEATRVLYVPEGDPIVAASPPEKVVWPLGQKYIQGRAMPIAGDPGLVIDETLADAPDRDRVIDAMNDLVSGLYGRYWLLGAPREVQGPVLQELPYHLEEQASPAERSRLDEQELAGEGWALLAQVDEDPDIDLAIGDGGSFYLLIPEVDLRSRRFDRVVGFQQSH